MQRSSGYNTCKDIKLQQAQKEIGNTVSSGSNVEEVHFDVKDVQKIIVNNLAKFDENIALIRDTYNIDLSFLKNCLNSFSNSESIIRDNGTITLSNLALMKLAEQENEFEKIAASSDLAHKALNLYELFKDVGISKLLNLSNLTVKKLIIATSVTADIDMTQYAGDSEGLDSFSYTQTISGDDLNPVAEAGAGSSSENVD